MHSLYLITLCIIALLKEAYNTFALILYAQLTSLRCITALLNGLSTLHLPPS